MLYWKWKLELLECVGQCCAALEMAEGRGGGGGGGGGWGGGPDMWGQCCAVLEIGARHVGSVLCCTGGRGQTCGASVVLYWR